MTTYCPYCEEEVDADDLFELDEKGAKVEKSKDCDEGLSGEEGWCYDCAEVTEGTEHYECAECGSDHWAPGEDRSDDHY